MKRTQEIERLLPRERKIHWGPRTLIWISILYGEEVIHTRDLSVPHRICSIACFVLEPLDEIAGWAWHPVEKKTIHQLKEILNKKRQ